MRQSNFEAFRLLFESVRFRSILGRPAMNFVRLPARGFHFGPVAFEAARGVERVWLEQRAPILMASMPIASSIWQIFSDAAGYELSDRGLETWDWGWKSVTPENDFRPLAADRPMVGISYRDCVAFCDWLSELSGLRVRLPTEIEFEFAAKAGCNCDRFCEGAAAIQRGCRGYGENAGRQPPAAPAFAPNGFGLRGMHGLIWQWCSDLVDSDGCIGSTAAAAGSELATWKGKHAAGSLRVIRGGSFAYPVEFRAAACAVSRVKRIATSISDFVS
jgi:formylglycine-generating enzyme required for sulfatase activity